MVDFDAWYNAFASEVFDDVLTVVGEITGGFVEENDTVDTVFKTFGGEKDVAIIATVVVGVIDA